MAVAAPAVPPPQLAAVTAGVAAEAAVEAAVAAEANFIFHAAGKSFDLAGRRLSKIQALHAALSLHGVAGSCESNRLEN